jgi:hypothetical protein
MKSWSYKRTRINAPATKLYMAALNARLDAQIAEDHEAARNADSTCGDALDLLRADAGLPWEPRRLPRDIDLFDSYEEERWAA